MSSEVVGVCVERVAQTDIASQGIGSGVFEYLPDLNQSSVPDSRIMLGSGSSQIVPLKLRIKVNRHTLLFIAIPVFILILHQLQKQLVVLRDN